MEEGQRTITRNFFLLESHSVDLEEAIMNRLGKKGMFVLEIVHKNFIWTSTKIIFP
jgi:hypothetical protein